MDMVGYGVGVCASVLRDGVCVKERGRCGEESG